MSEWVPLRDQSYNERERERKLDEHMGEIEWWPVSVKYHVKKLLPFQKCQETFTNGEIGANPDDPEVCPK
jgi:hypothetical protein